MKEKLLEYFNKQVTSTWKLAAGDKIKNIDWDDNSIYFEKHYYTETGNLKSVIYAFQFNEEAIKEAIWELWGINLK